MRRTPRLEHRLAARVARREVATRLREVLPSYMIPTRWKPFDALPKNVNGKIDRAALKRMFAEAF